MRSVCVVELHDAVNYITTLFASFCRILITRLTFLMCLGFLFCTYFHFMYSVFCVVWCIIPPFVCIAVRFLFL